MDIKSSGTCFNIKTDMYNCGTCASKCTPGYVCSAGKCSLSCQFGLTNCSGSCVNLQVDTKNCGKCGTTCASHQVCSGGGCKVLCQSGYTNCSGVCRNLQTNTSHCGKCGYACPNYSNAGKVCKSGLCAMGGCNTNYANCDNNTSNGCESNLMTDPNNCGKCGNKCAGCSGGKCTSKRSCREIKQAAPSSPSGNYTIDPDGSGPKGLMTVYCDMSYSGGGWTNFNFSAKRVYLANGIYILCNNGLTANTSSITCTNPLFNGNSSMPLYHYRCDGNDHSANYIKDHMFPLLGHNQSNTLGFKSFSQRYTSWTSSGTNEFCYVSGKVVRYNTSACSPYNSQGNGNCRPGFFTLNR